ncbi:M15 family metallopeptidase [Bacillus piscicola]|uniref:M15 family metallopeptidase n=1 Tax=Bacillus piscicola TaxID=1632684 RepID=UPI001F097281|nr:M15 family metallopeptidase [Bacillus piscicola]
MMKKRFAVAALIVPFVLQACSVTDEQPAPNEEMEEAAPVSTENEPAEKETVPPAIGNDGVLKDPAAVTALVNKEYRLPGDYEPEDLTVPDVPFPYEEDVPKKQLREPAARALEDLFAAAKEEGLSLFAVSGYRSYARQESIFTANVQKDGEAAANKYSARPGESEHQTGLTMDVSSPSNDFALTTAFGDTLEGKWLQDNAHHYGFIIRYPADKTDITGYQYEPWHLRYVGEKAAVEMHESGETLEEYYGIGTDS